MASSSQSAVTTKIRAKYGNFLTPNDYNKLGQCNSVTEIASILRENTIYKDTLRDIHESVLHRGNLELILKKAMFENLAPICQLDKIVGSSLNKQIINYFEIGILLTFFRNYTSDQPQSLLYILPNYFKEHSKINFLKLVTAKDYDDILSELKSLPYYSIIEMYPIKGNQGDNNFDINFTLLEAALYKYLYNSIFKALNDYDNNSKYELSMLFGTSADIHNLKTIWRSKRFYNIDSAKIEESVLLHGYKLSKETIHNLCNGTLDDFNYSISETIFGKKTKDSNLPFDLALNNILTAKCKKLISLSTLSSTTFASFIILLRTQNENLTTIIESVRYSTPIEQRTKFLIVT